MGRPTAADLARAAGVSVSTVNRVVAGGGSVRPATVRLVREAAKRIGFYGLNVIDSRLGSAYPKYRFGILLQQPNRLFYQELGRAMQDAARKVPHCAIDLQVEFLDDLSPQKVAERLLSLGRNCDAVGVVAAVHPIVTNAIDALKERGVPVFAVISPLGSAATTYYVGLDNWKVGRTAAWAMEHICRAPGTLGVLIGNHRYLSQEMNESGFRSYFREHAPSFSPLNPRTSFETASIAQECVEQLLDEHPDLVGLYIAGGGMSGVLSALRQSGKAGQIAVVGYQLMENTRAALLDGTVTCIISMPLCRLCEELLEGMVRSQHPEFARETFTSVLSFEIYTRENV